MPSLERRGRKVLLSSLVKLLALSLVVDADGGISEEEASEKEEHCYQAILYLFPLLEACSKDSMQSVLLSAPILSEEEVERLTSLLYGEEAFDLRRLALLLRTVGDLDEIADGMESYGQECYLVQEEDEGDFRPSLETMDDEEVLSELRTTAERKKEDDEDLRLFKNEIRKWLKKD